MSTKSLPIGTIVRVKAPECHHHNKEGMIVGYDREDHKEGPARVWFDESCDECSYLHLERNKGNYPSNPPPPDKQSTDPRTWNYKWEELVEIPRWSVDILATRLFGRQYHSAYELKNHPEIGSQLCNIEGCQAKMTKRILFNFVGSVYEAYTCDSCAEKYHGKCGEHFPLKDARESELAGATS